ncbi:hypothetical protein ACFPJ4_13460 [Lysinimonas soli]|uniref:DNA polymerase III subunit gamma/tau n=1 Tax=Lysinimonas soli TaxID=1074233 RepID=A0ABW0NS62_9MICO
MKKTAGDASEPDALDDDAEALSWAGDDLRGGIDPLTRNRAVDEVDAEGGDVGSDVAAAPRSIPRTAVTALFAVLYLAVVVGWILSVQITVSSATDTFSQVAWQFGEFVSIISGALWFLATLTLTRESRTAVRLGWFALGVVVLVPWPVLLAALG